MEKINVAELLKDCPKGMELDCTICNNAVTLESVDTEEYFPIRVVSKAGFHHALTREGCVYEEGDAKCVIFPKGKNTWEGFVPPCQFKDGDILTTITGSIFIYKKIDVYSYCGIYASLDIINGFVPTYYSYLEGCCRLATEEEKAKLFQAIKDNGYKWNEETKTLEKLIEPKFKMGDKVRHKTYTGERNIVTEIKDTHYILDDELALPFISQDEYELVPNKFDITTLKPFDKVLVRDFDNTPWEIEFFSRLLDGKHFKCFELSYVQCIPYEMNEYLLGKTDDCDEYFKTWE